MKTVLLIASLFFNLVFVVTLIIMGSSLLQKDKYVKSERQQAMIVAENAQGQMAALEASKKELAGRIALLEKERVSLSATTSMLEKELAEVRNSVSSQKPVLSSMNAQLEEFVLTGQSVDRNVLKATELGRLYIKMNRLSQGQAAPEQEKEIRRQWAEMIKLMDELGNNQPGNFAAHLNNPEEIKLSTDVIAGMFEELGQPMSDDQLAQYQAILVRLSGLKQSITDDSQNPNEKAIAYLQNADTLKAIASELAEIFTPDQKSAIAKTGMAGMIDNTNMVRVPNLESTSLIQLKNMYETHQYILDNWSRAVQATEEDKNSLNPIIDGYVQAYTGLRRQVEANHDKTFMDYYLQRNQPTDQNKMAAYYQERERVFQSNPDYQKAKIALDLEFLQVRNKYHKQIIQTLGAEKAATFVNEQPYIYHFPNIEY
jgi:hypothetical protein